MPRDWRTFIYDPILLGNPTMAPVLQQQEMRELQSDHLIRGTSNYDVMEMESRPAQTKQNDAKTTLIIRSKEVREKETEHVDLEGFESDEDLLLDDSSDKESPQTKRPPVPEKRFIEKQEPKEEVSKGEPRKMEDQDVSRELSDTRQENELLRQQFTEVCTRLQQAEEMIAGRGFRGFQRDDVRRLRAQLQMYHEEYQKLSHSHEDARRGVIYWQNAHKAVSEQWKQRENEIRQSQEGSIREMSDGRWNPIPDDILRGRFEELYKDVRAWAKAWAADSMHVDPEIADDFIKNYVARFVWYSKGRGLPEEITKPSSKMRDKIPMLLLTGALSYEIQTQFFENPFFCGEDSDGQVEALKKTHAELMKVNPREAHFWRSTWWRILNPPQNREEKETKEEDISGTTLQRVRRFCDHVDSDFRKGYARFLLRPLESNDEKNERARRLREILMTAANLATCLWTQRSSPVCLDMHGVLSRNMLFSIRSPFLQAHPLHRLDDDDDSFDGQKVMMVVKPALLAFNEDDTEGLGGTGFRVLAKAVVLLKD